MTGRSSSSALGGSAPKIVFVNRYFFPDHSATAQMLADLAFDLVRSGFRVQVVTSRQRYDDASAQLPEHEVIDGVTVRRVGGTRFGRSGLLGRALDYVSFARGARRLLAEVIEPGDIVVAKTDPPLLGPSVGGVVRRRGGHLVQWLQDLFPEVAMVIKPIAVATPVYAAARWWRNRWLRKSDALVAVGEGMMVRLRAEDAPTDKVRVIANWADTAALQPMAHADNPLRREWGLDDALVVAYSGNLGRVHEFEGLLEAATLLADRNDIRLLIIGGGAQRDAVRAVVEARKLTNALFKPYQPRESLAFSLAVADIHVVSQRPDTEGLVVPSKLYGALAVGRPVLFLGADDGEVARFLRKYDCGFRADASDGAAIAEILRRVAADRSGLIAMGERARRAAVAEGSRAVALAAWIDLLQSLGARSDALAVAAG